MANSKIPVAVLGATGAVGQRFIQLLEKHPWFEIVALAASEKSARKRYADACNWILTDAPPPSIQEMHVEPIQPTLPGKIVFSALPSDVAREVEPQFAKAGYVVSSNASAFRYESDVPLVVPEVNPDHLGLITAQHRNRKWDGLIITNPNCTTTGIVIALKPLHDTFGLRSVVATTMQAVSGAGYPGVPSLNIIDNVLTFIDGEEPKIEKETRLLLGRLNDNHQQEANIVVSSHTNRVPVLDGHTICLSLGFENHPTSSEAKDVLSASRPPAQVQQLPSSPKRPIIVRSEPNRPQPRRDRGAAAGMAVTVGRVRLCSVLDLRMTVVVHNTVRGAAGGSILNAELLVSRGFIT